jgi:hypothetical protein
MNLHNAIHVVLIISTSAFVIGILTTDARPIFADSRNLNDETDQNTECSVVGGSGSASNACNQEATNNVNTRKPEPTGTLLINKLCTSGPSCVGSSTFQIHVTCNNPQPSDFRISIGGVSLLH